MQAMSMAEMHAHPEAAAGTYATSWWFQMILNFIEAKFPGSSQYIEAAAAVIPWSKLWDAIQTALVEFQSGKDFITILQDVLSQWVTITPPTPNGPVMMAAKQ